MRDLVTASMAQRRTVVSPADDLGPKPETESGDAKVVGLFDGGDLRPRGEVPDLEAAIGRRAREELLLVLDRRACDGRGVGSQKVDLVGHVQDALGHLGDHDPPLPREGEEEVLRPVRARRELEGREGPEDSEGALYRHPAHLVDPVQNLLELGAVLAQVRLDDRSVARRGVRVPPCSLTAANLPRTLDRTPVSLLTSRSFSLTRTSLLLIVVVATEERARPER